MTVHALDQFGNIANENRAVSISLTNSAQPSDASSLVTMLSGSGTKNIIDHVAETVTISLVDSQHTLLNVQSTASVTFVPGKTSSFRMSDAVILHFIGKAASLKLLPTQPIGAGSFGKVSIQALDQYGNIAVSEQSAITVLASGNAIGATTLTILNGKTALYLTDSTIEIITVSLTSPSNPNLDVSSTLSVSFVAGLAYSYQLIIYLFDHFQLLLLSKHLLIRNRLNLF